jgi:hypothetical protein
VVLSRDAVRLLPQRARAHQPRTPPNGSIQSERDPDTYLTNLQSTFMGAFEARRHPWSAQVDFIYLNFGDLKTKVRSIRDPNGDVLVTQQTNLSSDLKGGLTQVAVGLQHREHRDQHARRAGGRALHAAERLASTGSSPRR